MLPVRAVALLAALLVAHSIAQAQTPADRHRCRDGTPIAFSENGKWGYLTPAGILIKPQFDVAAPFFDGKAEVCTKQYCWIVDEKGKALGPVRPRVGPFADHFSEGLGAAFDGSHWGFLDETGRAAVPFRYSFAGDFSDGLARVALGTGQDRVDFFIDHQGQRVGGEYKGYVEEFHEDLAAVNENGKGGYLRKDWTVAKAPQFEGVNQFSEGMAAVRIHGKVGYIDKTGAVVIVPAYDMALPFSEGLALVFDRGHANYIGHTGTKQFHDQFRIGHTFEEGVASVQTEDQKWGYIDHNGYFVIPPQFDSAMPFCAGIAAVATYRIIDPGEHGRAEKYEGRHGFIDHAGHYVWREPQDRQWESVFIF